MVDKDVVRVVMLTKSLQKFSFYSLLRNSDTYSHSQYNSQNRKVGMGMWLYILFVYKCRS